MVLLVLICNTKKRVRIISKPDSRDRWISNGFPAVTWNYCKLSYVSKFTYLGHVITGVLNDDDTKREITYLFGRNNMLISRFYK